MVLRAKNNDIGAYNGEVFYQSDCIVVGDDSYNNGEGNVAVMLTTGENVRFLMSFL